MEKIKFTGQARKDLGTKYSKNLRREGMIPCVLYSTKENIHFAVKPLDVRDIIYTPSFRTAEIELDGKVHPCIVKDIQWHPLTEDILHIDFLELEPNRPVKLELPVEFHGTSPGVKNGGIFQQILQKVTIKTTPENMVNLLHLDISELELGSVVRVRDLDTVEGIEILTSMSTPVATVQVPRALRSATAAEEGEEGELLAEGEEGESAEGGEGGEAAAE